MKSYFINFSFSLLLLIFVPVYWQSNQKVIPGQITKSLKVGDHEKLSAFFNDNIEIVILKKGATYSKPQAKMIIRNFFAENKPEDYIVLHQGGPPTSRYVIGNLTTKTGMFRIYYLIKTKDGKEFIHQLRFEKE